MGEVGKEQQLASLEIPELIYILEVEAVVEKPLLIIVVLGMVDQEAREVPN